MTSHECPRECEVAAALRQRGWRALDEEIRRHAGSCVPCAEVVAICEALASDLDAGRQASGSPSLALPSAGQVWHRATLRARADAVNAASCSLVWAFGLAGATVAGLAAAMVASLWPTMSSLVHLVAAAAASAAFQTGLPLIVAVGVCLALASVTVYLAIRGDRKM
jgi:hypothetical protein